MDTIQTKRKTVRTLRSVPAMLRTTGRTMAVALLAAALSATMATAQQRPTRAEQARMNAAMAKAGVQPGAIPPGAMMQPGAAPGMQPGMQPGMPGAAPGMPPPDGPRAPGPERKSEPKRTPAAPAAEPGMLPDPVLISGQELLTSDGVALQGTWFAGARGKDATPVLLLSGVGRSRNDYRQLGKMLQSHGFAVLAVNTRLAGAVTFEDRTGTAGEKPATDDAESSPDAADEDVDTDTATDAGTDETSPFDEPEAPPAPTVKNAAAKNAAVKNTTAKDAPAKSAAVKGATAKGTVTTAKSGTDTAKSGSGKKEESLLQKLRPDEVMGVVEDIETCRRWLARKNNAEELNLNALCIVAPDAIGLAAIEWMSIDWSGTSAVRQPFVAGPAMDSQTRQSQFSKALVLLSPVATLRNLNFGKMTGSQQILKEGMPIMLCVGTGNRDDMREAATIRRYFEQARKAEEKQKDARQKTFLYREYETDTTSSAMLGDDPQLAAMIAQFLREKVATNSGKSIPWNKARE